MRQGAQSWGTGMTLRDGMGREVGAEFGREVGAEFGMGGHMYTCG